MIKLYEHIAKDEFIQSLNVFLDVIGWNSLLELGVD